MLTELPGMVTVFEEFFHLEYSDSYTCNIHGDPRIEGYHYCICQHSQGTAVEALLALNHNSFILTVAIIGDGIYSIEAGGYKVFDSHARDMYHNSHSEGTCALLEIPSMHKLVYFQTLHWNEDIYELKGIHIATFEAHLFSSNVEHCNTSNVNSYQCSRKQCYLIAVYPMCYSLNHNYNKILNSDWLSTALILALIGQYASCLSNWTVRAITRALKWLFFPLLAKKISEFVVF